MTSEKYVADEKVQGFRCFVDGEEVGVVSFTSYLGEILLKKIKQKIARDKIKASFEIERGIPPLNEKEFVRFLGGGNHQRSTKQGQVEKAPI